MTSTVVMINLFGAVALLLFGLKQVQDGVTRAFGPKLRAGLRRGTGGSLRSFVSGLIATLALQSSTATAMMTASFVERGLIRSRMAQLVLLGANVGTALTAWIVAAGLDWISPLLIFAGMVLYRTATTAKRGIGSALIGIGLMLLSLHLLSSATEPMRESPALIAFVRLIEDAWPVALALSAGIAFLSSSSLAAVMLVLSLSSAGILSPTLTVVLVLGANLGGAVPPFIASLAGSASARRVTLGNLILRGAGCALLLLLLEPTASLLARLPISPARLPVEAHLAFNIALAALAWPFTRLLSRMLERLVPSDPEQEDGPRYLSQQDLSTPLVALANATREVLYLGDLIERMLECCAEAFEGSDARKLREIPKLERRVDRLQQEIKLYLSRLGASGLSEEESRRSMNTIDYAINLEHIGDIVEKGLLPQLSKKLSLGLSLSKEGQQELTRLFRLTLDNLRIGQTILVTRDLHLARQIMDVKVEVRRMEKQSSERHLARLREGQAESLQTSSLHLDLLRDLKRINAHIVAVAHPILDEGGILGESRLKSASG